MGNEINSPLSPAEIAALRRIVSIMVPADPAYAIPAAGDPLIFADILASLGRDLNDVRDAISALAGSLDKASAETTICSFLAIPTAAAAALSRTVLQCYYRDDRVLLSLGHEPSPPFPRGNVLPQGDWSLLDVVRGRPQFWRDDRKTVPDGS